MCLSTVNLGWVVHEYMDRSYHSCYSIHKRVVRVVCFYWVDVAAAVDLAYHKKKDVSKKKGGNRIYFFNASENCKT